MTYSPLRLVLSINMSFGKFSNWLLPKNLWTDDESYGTCNKCSAEICTRNRWRVIVAKIISLCYFISLFLYSLRVRFSSRVRLKPREKQVPAAPKSLKANVDKPLLKYKAVWRENVARESTFNGKHDVLIFLKICYTKITLDLNNLISFYFY